MEIFVYSTKKEASKAAAEKAKQILIKTIDEKGEATFVVATGASQLNFLEVLTSFDSIDWSKTTMFHLDEYIGISEDHPASFRRYLKENFISKVNKIGEIHLINGNTDPEKECKRLNKIIKDKIIDISFVGIGENGHIAFNEPPADFDTDDPFIIVELDDKSKMQQVGEGWFNSIEEVPSKAITMSVKQIMKSKNIICTVPDQRKAQAVKNCFGSSEITPNCPASVLKEHKNAFVYLDQGSASLLFKKSNRIFRSS